MCIEIIKNNSLVNDLAWVEVLTPATERAPLGHMGRFVTEAKTV